MGTTSLSQIEPTRILVVDDLPEKLLTYQVILEEPGIELVTAQSGADALRLVLAHEFAVILLDVNMPGMDGFETAALIRQRRKSAHTPIIFVTAFTDDMRMAKGYAQGAVDYILAPVVPEMLRAKISVFVDLFRMTQQVKAQADEQIALAEERSRRTAVEESNRRLGFLARAGAVLGSSLDRETTARDLVRLTMPILADEAALVLAEASGGDPHVIAGRHEAPSVVLDDAATWRGLSDSLAAAITAGLATGAEQFLPGESAANGESPAVAILPLQARGRTFGVLALSRTASRRHFSSSDLTMAEALISRAASALDNALLFKELENADRQKNEFLSMLAHELRNPLAPIRSAVDVLRMCKDQDDDVVWAQDVIDRQVTHLVKLVDELLDVSRITRGKIKLERTTFDLADVVRAAVETSQPLIAAGRHQLAIACPQGAIWVDADKARLSQVLSNLLNNAAKYTPPDGAIWLTADCEGDEAVIRVRDNGVGIPPEMLARVFDLFQQVDRSLDRSQGGLGIGLTLARRLVEMHGGQIEAASDGPGSGSEFTVRLPGVRRPTADSRPATPVESADDNCSYALRVLVVDDNIDAANSIARLLRLRLHHVEMAHDGPDALEAADKLRPDAVLLDLGLPRINGYEVARRLREANGNRKLLLIAVSGYGSDANRQQAAEVGFDHYFVKPLDVEQLLLKLAEAGNSTLAGKM